MADVTAAPSTIYDPLCGQHLDLSVTNHPSHHSKPSGQKLIENSASEMFSSHTETFTQRRATWPWHVIRIKAEKFCETSPTAHLSRSHPQHSAGWDLCLICYQTQLVFPADVHRPAVMKPLFCTNCVKICQGWCPRPLTSGASLWYIWQTLVPKVPSLPGRTGTSTKCFFFVFFLNGDTYTGSSVWWDPSCWGLISKCGAAEKAAHSWLVTFTGTLILTALSLEPFKKKHKFAWKHSKHEGN